MKSLRFCVLLLVIIVTFSSFSAAETPKYGGTLITSNFGDPDSLNPVWKYDVPAYPISHNIYSTLVIMDYGITIGHEPYGDLAKSWDFCPEELTYTFYLHDDVYWHDGVKFTSADVKFTYETAIEKRYPIAAYLKIVEEILTPDDYTLVMKLSEDDVTFIPMLSQASNWYGQIIAKHLYEGTDIETNPYNHNPVGTGPFKLDEWVDGEFVVLKANEDYFRGRPYLDKIIFRIYTDREVAKAEFIGGQIDHLNWNLTPVFHELDILAQLPGIRMWSQPGIYSNAVQFNHNRAPLNDLRVREAICLAIDREEVSHLAYAGLMPPWYHASSVGTPLYTNEDVVWPEMNVAMAEQLLDEAGYLRDASGNRMDLVLISTTYYQELSEVIIAQLRKLGINVRHDLVDLATWFTRMEAGDFDLNPYYTRYGPDPDAYAEHFMTGGVRNFGKYSNPRVDELLMAGRRPHSFDERKTIYDEVQKILLENFAYLPVTELWYFELSTEEFRGTPMGDPSTYGKSFGWQGYYSSWLDK